MKINYSISSIEENKKKIIQYLLKLGYIEESHVKSTIYFHPLHERQKSGNRKCWAFNSDDNHLAFINWSKNISLSKKWENIKEFINKNYEDQVSN